MTARPHISFLFYIKRTKLLKNGEAPIYLKIKVGTGKAELALFRSIQPELWDSAKNKARGYTAYADQIDHPAPFVLTSVRRFKLTTLPEDKKRTIFPLLISGCQS